MIDFEKTILNLREKRKIFHSEDDLKFSLAFEMKKLFPEIEIRLEKPIEIKMLDVNKKESVSRVPIDIIIHNKNGESIPIELKYKTKKLEINDKGELYNLTTHGAYDIGRYSFRKDIYRIEKYLEMHKKSNYGFVLILTNENKYVEDNVGEKEIIDKHFSFHQNSLIKKEYKGWNYSKIDQEKYEHIDNQWKIKNIGKKHWTHSKDINFTLNLNNDYHIQWHEYSKKGNSEFKYCLIKIEKLK